MRDLWPNDLFRSQPGMRAPVAILKEQASALGQKTQNLIEARVESARSTDASEFIYEFNLLARTLDYYTYELFYVVHDIELYPVSIAFDDFEGGWAEAKDQESFVSLLQSIFASDKTRRVIGAIMAQVRH